MESILNIPSEYWKTYMDVESDDDIRTPELKPGTVQCIPACNDTACKWFPHLRLYQINPKVKCRPKDL